MERVIKQYSSFDEAEQADFEFYRSLTPAQRIAMLLEMLEFVWPDKNGAPPRLERVYRFAEFPPR